MNIIFNAVVALIYAKYIVNVINIIGVIVVFFCAVLFLEKALSRFMPHQILCLLNKINLARALRKCRHPWSRQP